MNIEELKNIKEHTELPGYQDDFQRAGNIDSNRDVVFVSRWYPVYLMDIKIRQLTLKDFLVLSAEKNEILYERFNFSDCVKFLYLLHYKPTNSLLLKSYRDYTLGKKIIKYIQKTYPQIKSPTQIEEKLNQIIQDYWDDLLNDFPARNVPRDEESEKPPIHCYNGYSFGSMISLMLREYNFSEKELMELPIQVFFEYYQCLLSSKNQDYTRHGKSHYVDFEYRMRFDRIKKIIVDENGKETI